MYEVKYIDGCFWIVKDDKICTDLGSFEDPISPRIFIEEIENNGKI